MFLLGKVLRSHDNPQSCVRRGVWLHAVLVAEAQLSASYYVLPSRLVKCQPRIRLGQPNCLAVRSGYYIGLMNRVLLHASATISLLEKHLWS